LPSEFHEKKGVWRFCDGGSTGDTRLLPLQKLQQAVALGWEQLEAPFGT
jgi:hypothetical protein